MSKVKALVFTAMLAASLFVARGTAWSWEGDWVDLGDFGSVGDWEGVSWEWTPVLD
jgi:hypothetical protein